jgi:hypothetical protein
MPVCPFTVPPPPPTPVARPSAPLTPKTPNDIPPTTFRATSQLAIVGFQVLSAKGQLIRDLRPDEIELREDGVPQIGFFEGGAGRTGGTPVDIALLFDCSPSVEVAGALDTNVFKQNILEEFENVRIAIYGFSAYLVRTTAPTRDTSRPLPPTARPSSAPSPILHGISALPPGPAFASLRSYPTESLPFSVTRTSRMRRSALRGSPASRSTRYCCQNPR